MAMSALPVISIYLNFTAAAKHSVSTAIFRHHYVTLFCCSIVDFVMAVTTLATLKNSD